MDVGPPESVVAFLGFTHSLRRLFQRLTSLEHRSLTSPNEANKKRYTIPQGWVNQVFLEGSKLMQKNWALLNNDSREKRKQSAKRGTIGNDP